MVGEVSVYQSLTKVDMNIEVMRIIIPNRIFSWSVALYLYHGYIDVSEKKVEKDL